MPANQIGFIVRHTVQGESGRFHVIGRCGDEPIRQGDMFGIVRVPDRMGDDNSLLGTVHHVQLIVVAIESYQRNLGELGGGMTGTIGLEGTGIERVVPGAILEPPVRLGAREGSLPAEAGTEN